VYEIAFAQREPWLREMPFAPVPGQAFDASNVERALALTWEEHCVECATPECFDTCPLHEARSDGACARFDYGIVPNEAFAGLFDFGADLRFRRWGKLEARLVHASVFAAPFGQRDPEAVSRTTNPGEVARWITEADALVVEAWSPESEPFDLVLEYFVLHPGGRESRMRRSLELAPGHNLHRIPVAELNVDPDHTNGFIHLTPDRAGRRVVFTWLDVVTYRSDAATTSTPAGERVPAAKVKCVAWDLDNTLWDGVLINGIDPEANVRAETVACIKALDERGVLQTIVSKNDWEQAWDAVGQLELQEFFLHPAINWGQKSENLKTVAQRLNIGLDTFAMVDDSAFERSEVQQALPEVRVFSDEAIPTLLERSELDLPVTDASRTRRQSYLAETERQEIRAAFTGDYLDFLRSCAMIVELFQLSADPEGERHVLRCWELLQRSNQLNLSGTRYERDAFDALVGTEGVVPVAFRCRDRFGNYGVVGYATLDEREAAPVVRDLVISCRVAQKRVEQAFLAWICNRYAERGHKAVDADLFLGGRNALITKALHQGGWSIAKMSGKRMLMRRSLADPARLARELAAEPLTIEGDATLA